MVSSFRPFAQNGSSVLLPRTTMKFGDYLLSPNQRFQLIFQSDSNLALYDRGTAVWSPNATTPYSNETYFTRPQPGEVSSTYMSNELHLVDLPRARRWTTVNSTPLDGNLDASAERTYLQVQDDGNLVIVDAIPVWANNKSIPVTPDKPAAMIPPGVLIYPGQSFSAGTSNLVFQADGNLVLYGVNNAVLWASYTQGKGAALASMQADGNFVIYDAANKPLWYTNTTAFPGSYARFQEDGSFSIVVNKVVWARFGFTPTVKVRTVYYPDHTKAEENSTKPYPTYGEIGYEF